MLAALALLAAACGDVGPAPAPVTVYHTAHFAIVDSAGMSPALIDTLKLALEADYQAVGAFLPEFPAPDSVTMVVRATQDFPFSLGGSAVIGQSLFGDTLALSYLPHQLTHVWTGYQRRAFFEEGLAVYVTTQLVPESLRPDPYRGALPHEWMSLFSGTGSAIPLEAAYEAANFEFDLSGSSPDASAWQLFVEAGSFTQWVIDTYGRAAWLRLYHADTFEGGLGATAATLEPQWFRATQVAYPQPRSCEDILGRPLGTRETFWCRRAEGL